MKRLSMNMDFWGFMIMAMLSTNKWATVVCFGVAGGILILGLVAQDD